MKHKISLYWLLFTALLVALPSQASEHVTYYVNDALGSPIMAMDEQGAVVWQESYQPYGQRQIKPAAANYDEQFYTGKQEEPDIGLQYFGARWYDPEAGRFTSIDPVGVQEGEMHSFNRYAYANNNPYRFTDPNGESPVDVLFLAMDVGSLAFHAATGNSAGAASAAVDVAFSVVGLFSPIPGAGQVLKSARVFDKAAGVASKTTVGRWMSSGELAKMQKTGKVQESISGTTHVANPADAEAFIKQTKTGNHYVEFDVPTSSLKQTNEGWAQIAGPNSLSGRLAAKKGEAVPQMPAAENIVHKATKFR